MRDAATSAPASSTSCLKIWRSSPLLIASKLAPMSSTSYFCEDAVIVQVDRGVQRGLAAQGRQDRVGRSFAMIVSITCHVIGSM